MDTPVATQPQLDLYERDFHAWCLEQAARLRSRVSDVDRTGLDYANLAEEIESLGRSDRRAIRSHTRVLLAHLLKWRFQPERRSVSWESTINNARTEIADLLSDSPSLVSYAAELISEVYSSSVRDAATETGLPRTAFPDLCPFSVEEVLDSDFLP